jgi:hypothetical protein
MAKVYIASLGSKGIYFSTTEHKPAKVYFSTAGVKKAYITIEEPVNTRVYIITPGFKRIFVTSEDLDLIPPYLNICRYPKELELIRQKAILLIWNDIKNCFRSSIYEESYGKESLQGYNKAGILRLLLDYLSSIWIEKNGDSKSGLVRTSDFYYNKYNINNIINALKKCQLNVKPIVALFDLNSYTIIDDQWPNYFMMDKVIHPPDEKKTEMRQWTDIYTLQPVTPDRNQAIKSLSASQTSFLPTKTIRYFSAFTINGVDYTGYTDYNANSVTYSPSQLFGYNIENNDTVIIKYWYEE